MLKQPSFPTVNILGVGVDAVSRQQAIDFIIKLASSNRAAYVVKPYVEFIDRALRDPQVCKLLNEAELCLADGVGLRWAASYLDGPSTSFLHWITSIAGIVLQPRSTRKVIPERLAGSAFTWPLLKACAQHQLSVYLVGSPKHHSISDVAQHIAAKLPDLKIAGTTAGKDPAGGAFSKTMQAQLLKQLQQLKPDIVLLGLGFPLQEQIARALSHQLNHGVLIGEGGTFDFSDFGGRLHKAPKWLQAIDLEWLWRLLREPSRLKRQLAIPRFMWAVYKSKRINRKLPSPN